MLITTTEEYKRAIERQGDFGRLFLEYIGCPRGAVGRMGSSGGECPSDCQRLTKEVLLQPVIKDVDGGRWIPVNEDALKELVEKYAATCDLLEHRVPTEEDNKPLTVDELREGCEFCNNDYAVMSGSRMSADGTHKGCTAKFCPECGRDLRGESQNEP